MVDIVVASGIASNLVSAGMNLGAAFNQFRNGDYVQGGISLGFAAIDILGAIIGFKMLKPPPSAGAVAVAAEGEVLFFRGLIAEDIAELVAKVGYAFASVFLLYMTYNRTASVIKSGPQSQSSPAGPDYEGRKIHGTPEHDAKLRKICDIFDKYLGVGRTLFRRWLKDTEGRNLRLQPDNMLEWNNKQYIFECESESQTYRYFNIDKRRLYNEVGIPDDSYIIIRQGEEIMDNKDIRRLIGEMKGGK